MQGYYNGKNPSEYSAQYPNLGVSGNVGQLKIKPTGLVSENSGQMHEMGYQNIRNYNYLNPYASIPIPSHNFQASYVKSSNFGSYPLNQYSPEYPQESPVVNNGSIYPDLPPIDFGKLKNRAEMEKIQNPLRRSVIGQKAYASFVEAQAKNQEFEDDFGEGRNNPLFKTTMEDYRKGEYGDEDSETGHRCRKVELTEEDDVLLCCITQEIMTDPVITPYGHCFERSAIEEWVAKHKTCPITNKPLDASQLFPCYPLKQIIDRLK